MGFDTDRVRVRDALDPVSKTNGEMSWELLNRIPLGVV